MSPRPRRRHFGARSTPGRPRSPGGRGHLAWTVSPLLLAVTALGRSSQNAGQTTYPLLGRSALHMSNSTIGGLGAAAGVMAILCAGLVGRARREHALALLAAGQACGLAAFALLALPSGRIGVGVAAVALGAYGGLAFPSIMTAIGSGPRQQRAKALAIFATALSASLLVGPLLEAAVLKALDGSLRATFAVLLPLPAASTVLALLAVTRARKVALIRGAEEEDRRSSGQRAEAPTPGGVGSGPAAVRGQPAFRVAVTMMVTYQVPFAALVTFGALLARHTDGLSASGAEAAFGVFFGVSLLVRTSLAILTPRRATAMLLAASVAATAAGLALVAEARGFPLLLCGMVLLGLPHGATLPLASGLLAERTPEHQLSRANGLLMATTNTVTVVVPPFCGWLADAIGYPHTFLVLEVPVVILGALLVAQLRSPRFPAVTWEAEITELPADA